jgi:Cu2+-exporting ATPase
MEEHKHNGHGSPSPVDAQVEDAGHADHGSHAEPVDHGAHVDHTGHEAMFRRRFWIRALMPVPFTAR